MLDEPEAVARNIGEFLTSTPVRRAGAEPSSDR
jgi:hypothetical protein